MERNKFTATTRLRHIGTEYCPGTGKRRMGSVLGGRGCAPPEHFPFVFSQCRDSIKSLLKVGGNALGGAWAKPFVFIL